MHDDIGIFGLLKSLGEGRVLDDLHKQFTLLLAAVKESHKKGKVILTIEVEPDKAAEVEKVAVHGDVSAKIPHVNRGHELFYVTENNHLSRRNPRQPALPPNTVRMPPVGEENDIDGQSRAAGEKA